MRFLFSPVLEEKIKQGALPSSVCLEVLGSERGVAEEIAGRLFCETKSFCGECIACQKILHRNEEALLYLEKGESTSLSIDQVRHELLPFVARVAAEKPKLVFMEGCEQLRKEPANALLKVLEEPPDATHIFLLTTSYASVLPTLLSRCFLSCAEEEGIEERIIKEFGVAVWEAHILRYFYPIEEKREKLPKVAWKLYLNFCRGAEGIESELVSFAKQGAKLDRERRINLQILLTAFLLFVRDSLLGQQKYSPERKLYPYPDPLQGMQNILVALRLIHRNLYLSLLVRQLFDVLRRGTPLREGWLYA